MTDEKNKGVPLRICLVSGMPPPLGGIARWGEMLTAYARSNPLVEIFVVDTAVRWRSVYNKKILYRVVGGALHAIKILFNVLYELISNKIDVVHITTSGQLGLLRDVGVLLACKIFGVPFVYHIRFGRVPEMQEKNSAEWRILKTVCAASSAVLTLDRATFDALSLRAKLKNVQLVPNFFDFTSMPPGCEKGAKNTVKKVFFLGWIEAAKGVSDLLAAWGSIAPDGWILEIAGPCDPDYLKEIDVPGIRDKVKFLGALSHSDAMLVMARCDIFVLPSHSEGFPNVIVEAMAFGRAIVATKVGAIPEMLNFGECGLLLNAGDQEQLAIEVLKLCSDEGLRGELGEKAKSRAKSHYSIESVFGLYLNIWGGVAGKFVK